MGWGVLAAGIGLVLAGGCGGPEPAPVGEVPGERDGRAMVSLQTDWYPQPEYGGYYQALERGFYREAGLEVEIRPGGPNAQVIQTVALGRADIGMTDGNDVLTAIGRGVPVVIVGVEMQRNPQGLMFHAARPLRDFRELDGKTLMAGPGSAWVEYLRQHYGIDFQLQPLMGDLSRFLRDEAFIQQCFVTNEPYFARQQGADAGTLLIASSGYDPYRVIFTSRAFAQAQPGRVRAFVAATVRGYRDFLEGDPAPALRAIGRLNERMTPDFMAYARQALIDNRLVGGEPERGEAVGRMSRERLAGQIAILRRIGILERDLTVEEAARFDLLPGDPAP